MIEDIDFNVETAKVKIIGEGSQAVICTPLVGRTRVQVLSELEKVLVKSPDVIEWRADFFESLVDIKKVVAFGNEIKKIVGDIPMIFTIRSIREGGQPISLSDGDSIKLNAAICIGTNIEYVDCELSNLPEDIKNLIKTAHENNTKVIASFHNFDYTPSRHVLFGKFVQAETYGMDVAKIAVMPKQLEDVLALLNVTLEAKNKIKIPVITMSMGELGAITRMIGGLFGSCLTFAVGQSTSAPGQIPIEDLRQIINIVQKYTGNESKNK